MTIAPARRAATETCDDGLIAIGWADLCGLVRVRAVPASTFQKVAELGVGFPACGQALDVMGGIAANRWGPMMDIRNVPDPSSLVEVNMGEGLPSLRFALADMKDSDGREWPCCTRTLLRHALDDLQQVTGLTLLATFEVEFKLISDSLTSPLPMTLEAFRAVEPFGSALIKALSDARIEVDAFEPEFGFGQYEVSYAPTEGIQAADQAIQVREIIRAIAQRFGYRATFTPKDAPNAVGSGAHIHFSLVDASNAPAFYDADKPHQLSEVGQRFAAGILAHTRSILAFSAPSVVSYQRLGPSRWTSGFTAFGVQNREAALRVCISSASDPDQRARSFNLEFRPVDSTCNPYLVLAILLRAGLHGIEEALDPPPFVDCDPATLSEDDREKLGIIAFPQSLKEALDCLQSDPIVTGWLPEELLETYRNLKLAEIAAMSGLSDAEVCARYLNVY